MVGVVVCVCWGAGGAGLKLHRLFAAAAAASPIAATAVSLAGGVGPGTRTASPFVLSRHLPVLSCLQAASGEYQGYGNIEFK